MTSSDKHHKKYNTYRHVADKRSKPLDCNFHELDDIQYTSQLCRMAIVELVPTCVTVDKNSYIYSYYINEFAGLSQSNSEITQSALTINFLYNYGKTKLTYTKCAKIVAWQIRNIMRRGFSVVTWCISWVESILLYIHTCINCASTLLLLMP